MIFVAYNQPYNMIELEDKSSSCTGNMKQTKLWKNGYTDIEYGT